MPLNEDENRPVKYLVVIPTGEIVRSGSCPLGVLQMQRSDGGEEVLANVSTAVAATMEGVTAIHLPEAVDDSRFYWNGTGLAEYPERPSVMHEWTGSEWIDPQRQEDVDAERAAYLQLVRRLATLPKLEFVMRVVFAGILSQESGLAVLDGRVPEELQGMTEGMDPLALFQLQAKLKGAVQFDRLDPFILATADYLGIPPEYIDNVYGIDVS